MATRGGRRRRGVAHEGSVLVGLRNMTPAWLSLYTVGAMTAARGALQPQLIPHALLRHRATMQPRLIAIPPVKEDEDSFNQRLDLADRSPAGDGSADAASAPTPLLAPGPFRFCRALWRFSRPHTIIGSALCIPSLTAFAAPTAASLASGTMWAGAAYAVLPALLMNVYIVGLNQLFDIDIDRVNKPTLPLASGDLSARSGVAICVLSLLASLLMGFAHPLYSTLALKATLVGSALLGTAYSLPPLRLKRFPLLAATCIMSVRGA